MRLSARKCCSWRRIKRGLLEPHDVLGVFLQQLPLMSCAKAVVVQLENLRLMFEACPFGDEPCY